MTVPLRLIIVEDHQDDAELMVGELQRAGYEPQWRRVETETQFIAALQQSADVILADGGAATFDAPAALDLTRRRGDDFPLIVVSERTGEEAAVDAMKQGAADYVLKDRLARLGPAVTSALEQSRLRAQRREAEIALRQSEQRYREYFVRNLAGMFTSTPDGQILGCNYSFARIFGYDSPQELMARHAAELYESPQDRAKFLEQLRRHGMVAEHEKRLRRRDGSAVWVLENVQFARTDEGAEIIQGTVIDITQRKRAQQLLAGQNQVLEFLALGEPLPKVLETLCRMLEACADGMLCSVLFLDQREQCLRFGAAPNLPDAYNRAVDGIPIGPAVGSCGTAAYTGRRVIVEDIATDPLWDQYRQAALVHGLRACWSDPIRSGDGQVLGTFAMYYRQPRRPTDEDLRLIETATHLAGFAIQRRRAEDARRASYDMEHLLLMELDHRVRNNLSALQSLIDIARRGATSIDGFAAAMHGRIRAMAIVHGLLSSSHWEPVELSKLIGCLAPAELVRQIETDGPPVHIPARQVTALAMVLQEWLTNSAKYGALTSRDGRVHLAWTRPDPAAAPQQLRLCWSERGGPAITRPAAPGVGTQLVQGLARSELRGEVHLTYPPSGACHELTMMIDEPQEHAAELKDAGSLAWNESDHSMSRV